MDDDGKQRRANTSQRTYAPTEEPGSSSSRTYYEPESSHLSPVVHASTFPGRTNYATSSAPVTETWSTAVHSSRPAASGNPINSAASSRILINRKPVERRTFSESSPITDSGSRSRSSTESRPTHLAPVAPQGQATSSTSMLFNQASRSLTSLTQGLNDVDIHDPVESPPPYVDPPTSSARPSQMDPPASSVQMRDVKQQNTLGDLGINEAPPDAIDLVRENRLDLLQRLLEQGFVIDDVDPTTKRTAVMEAASLRRIGAARILIRSGCRLHLKDIDGWSALHFASDQGDEEMCRLLLDAGAQLDEYSTNGDTPLTLAARGGHTDVVMCLLNSWAAQMSSSVALLNGFLEASKSGNVRTAELFVERGINPKKMQDSWRPVIYAAQSGSVPMIDFMIAHKCNLKQRDPEGRSGLHFAAALGNTAMVEKLLAWKLSWNTQTRKNQETALHYATLGRQSSTAMALILHRSANISMKDAHGVQALHHCVRNGDALLTTTLLNQGARLDEQTRFGWTPMLLACAYGHLPLVAEFITRGVSLDEKLASPSVKPRESTNEAARRGYWAEIRWPHPGARPLHLALEFSQDEVVNTLIAAGAKIEESDSEGWRPLHYAAFNARINMVELLLNRGASPHATTSMGNTPFSLGFRESGLTATYEEKLQVCELLSAAMSANKKSKFRKLSDAMTAPLNKSREVAERNKIWHTAQLADALYQTEQLDYTEMGEESKLTTTFSKHSSIDNDDDDSGYGDSWTIDGSQRHVRTWTE